MSAADEAWIQNSLARLEDLEAQKERLEATGQTAKLAEVNAEIRALYEALEAVAEDDEEAAANAGANAAPAFVPVAAMPPPAAAFVPSPAPMPAPVPMPAAAPAMSASPFDAGSPFGSPAPAAPPSMPIAASPMMASPTFDRGISVDESPAFGSVGSYDDDVSPPKSKTPLVLGGLVLVAGLVGGGWYLSQGKPSAPAAPAAAPAGDPTVIMAAEIPDDTQEPDAAQGGSADRTPGASIKKTGRSDTSSRPRSDSRSKPRSDRGSEKKDDGRKINVGEGADPLAGLD